MYTIHCLMCTVQCVLYSVCCTMTALYISCTLPTLNQVIVQVKSCTYYVIDGRIVFCDHPEVKYTWNIDIYIYRYISGPWEMSRS